MPGLFVTASENEYVRIWDIQNNEMELIHEKKLKLVKEELYFVNKNFISKTYFSKRGL